MKQILAIAFLLIYALGAFEANRVILNFYWNRDDYTQRFCTKLDEGITTCRASCYLENLLEQERNTSGSDQITMAVKNKWPENKNMEVCQLAFRIHLTVILPEPMEHKPIDTFSSVFHPPKAS